MHGSPLRAPCVWADDDGILYFEVVPDPLQRAWLRVEIVDGHVEEALDLAGVQVHGDDMVAAGRLQHVGHEAGGDGSAGPVLLVLPRVGEVGDHGCYAPCGGGLAGGDYDEELHYVVVYVARRGGLEDEDWI